ncbi:MAG: aspartate 1-decarboxylase [bacterium]|nr:aspartate 1-decarboxylase [bacterium]
MFRIMCKSKITGANVSGRVRECSGSIGIDSEVMERADILQGEKVHVLNQSTGARFETYAIREKSGSRKIVLYGPATRLGEIEDSLVILSYSILSDEEARLSKLKVVKL